MNRNKIIGNGRAALIVLVLLNIACGRPKVFSDPPPVTCDIMQSDARQIKYPDGLTRKSNVFSCTNSCEWVQYVDDPSNNFYQCPTGRSVN
jgi:hypothetical protein